MNIKNKIRRILNDYNSILIIHISLVAIWLLITLHLFFYYSQIFPLLHVLFKGRQSMYLFKTVFKYIEKNLVILNCTRFNIGFNRQLRKAFRSLHPGVVLCGSNFHYKDVLIRKAAAKDGFYNLLQRNRDSRLVFNYFLCLPFLPDSDVYATLLEIRQKDAFCRHESLFAPVVEFVEQVFSVSFKCLLICLFYCL